MSKQEHSVGNEYEALLPQQKKREEKGSFKSQTVARTLN